MKVLIINGPNLNNLGRRDASHYGVTTLAQIEEALGERASELGAEVDFFQSNHEGEIVDFIQRSTDGADGIVINAGALTHYGLSMRDALTDSRLPIVEVHLSNIHARDEFRRHSVIADIAVGQIAGMGWRGYIYALDFLSAHLGEQA
ncbi:MAG: type II 3-dehydroquinate dehydratase [Dehalococcoidia bacterium]|nr:type II 3-dehydroquinate dehydratase [Dehalococcoidia bacterium]